MQNIKLNAIATLELAKHQDNEVANDQLPYITLEAFNAKVDEYAKTNVVLKALFSPHKYSKIKTWEDLPPHLIQDLFKRLGCKPSIQKY